MPNTTSENKMRCWLISKPSLTLGAEAWSGPIPLICSALFFASFVLVASRLQGGKFLAREWRWLVWSLSTCKNEAEDNFFPRKEYLDEQFLIKTCRGTLTISLYSMCYTGLCPGPYPCGLCWRLSDSLLRKQIPFVNDMQIWAVNKNEEWRKKRCVH